MSTTTLPNQSAATSTGRKTINIRILRQLTAEAEPFWEDYSMPYRPNMNVISVLMELRGNPYTTAGEKSPPVAWDAACLEEVCGSCSMNINGMPRQACSALVDQLPDPIVLEPFSKFPVVRDLVVNRDSMFENLKRIKAWVPIDGTYDLGEGPRMNEEDRAKMYVLSTCMTCGCCLEACPQVNEHSDFIGPAAISQVRLFNGNPTGQMQAGERLDAIMEEGGVQGCGKAGNCIRVCPKGIPLTESIYEINRQATGRILKKFFKG